MGIFLSKDRTEFLYVDADLQRVETRYGELVVYRTDKLTIPLGLYVEDMGSKEVRRSFTTTDNYSNMELPGWFDLSLKTVKGMMIKPFPEEYYDVMRFFLSKD